MRGSIRTVGGFLICFGAVGGLDNGSPVVACVVAALVGLALMASGVSAMNSRKV